jgi:hypothetical protein
MTIKKNTAPKQSTKVAKPVQTEHERLTQQVIDLMLLSVKAKKPEVVMSRHQAVCLLIEMSLQNGKDSHLFAALDALFEQNSAAYEQLADHIEYCVQSQYTDDGYVNVLMMVPVLVWSSNQLPSGKVDMTVINAFSKALKDNWLTDDATVLVSDILHTPDTLPEGFCDTYAFARTHFALADKGLALNAPVPKMTKGAKTSKHAMEPKNKLSETAHNTSDDDNDNDNGYLADSRFLLAVVRGRHDQDIFKGLLDKDGNVDMAAQEIAWTTAATPALAPYFVGCAYDVLPMEPFYPSSRTTEMAIRGFSLQAAALMVMTSMEVSADELRAVIAPCHGSEFEEYRISILLKNNDAVLQGITWPLLGREETQEAMLEEILGHLKNLGVHRIRLIEDAMPMEYCDDCEAPLFPDPNAEMVHQGTSDDDDDEPNPARHTVH